MPHTIINAFTSAAALLIALNQLKTAFGFSKSPKNVEYNYEIIVWYIRNWNGKDEQTGNFEYLLSSSYFK